MLMLFLEQVRWPPTWFLRATWCPRAPRWWPLPDSFHSCRMAVVGGRAWDATHKQPGTGEHSGNRGCFFVGY